MVPAIDSGHGEWQLDAHIRSPASGVAVVLQVAGLFAILEVLSTLNRVVGYTNTA